jgi:hypothetical protein
VQVSRNFHWVYVDRDVTPEIPKRFNVSAYPTLLALNPKGEKIHRFSAFREAGPFKVELEKALARHAKFKAGQEWDLPDPRPDRICDQGRVDTIPAPSDEVPGGLAHLAERLWVVQGSKLFKLDPRTGKVEKEFEIPGSIQDLATDGQELFALDAAWSSGGPILVLDPATGQVKRRIVTEENRRFKSQSSRGLEWFEGSLAVLDIDGSWVLVDPADGRITARRKSRQAWVYGLALDGKRVACGSKSHLLLLDAKSGEVSDRIPLNYPVRAVGAHDGAYYLMEQPLFDFDKAHRPIRQWPKTTRIHILRLGQEY